MSLKRNIVYLLGGTGIAQVFTFAISPLLTRLYTPKDFGVLGVVLAASSIIAVVAHLRLNLAIALASTANEAKVIMKSSMILTWVISLFSSLGLYIYSQITGNQDYTGLIICFIFLFAILNSNVDILNYWQSYRGRHKESARNSVIRSTTTGIFQILLSMLTPLGLVIGGLVGALASIFMYIRDIFKVGENKIQAPVGFKVIKDTIKSNRSFPLYSMPQGLLASASLNAVPIILGSAFGIMVAGQYWLAYRMLLAPIALLGGAYRQVLHPIFSNMDTPTKAKIKTAKQHTMYFFVLLVPVMIFCFIFLETIFTVIFGKEWSQAGIFAGWLVLCFSLDIIKVPCVTIIHALKLHKNFLVFEIILGITRVSSLLYSLQFNSPELSIIIFTIMNLFLTIIFIYLVLNRWTDRLAI